MVICRLRRDVNLRTQARVHTVRTLSSWLLIETLVEQNVVTYPCPTLGYIVKSALSLDVLQELIHQGYMLHEGTCQICDLSRQVLFAIRGQKS